MLIQVYFQQIQSAVVVYPEWILYSLANINMTEPVFVIEPVFLIKILERSILYIYL